MTKIYIVRGSSGEYSDRTEWVVVACKTKSHANRIAGKLRGLVKHNLECTQKMHHEFEIPYLKSHPRPEALPYINASEEFVQMQKVSKKTCGDDLRAAWKRLDQANNERVQANKRNDVNHTELMRIWNEEFDKAKERYNAEHQSVPEHLQEAAGYHNKGGYFDGSYDVYSVELIDDQT